MDINAKYEFVGLPLTSIVIKNSDIVVLLETYDEKHLIEWNLTEVKVHLDRLLEFIQINLA